MFNKKRLFVAGAFLIALLFMTMYAGGLGERGTTAMRIVKFIDGFNNAEISSQNIKVGGKAEVPDNPKHEDLLFIGWYDGDTEVSKFENIMEDLTVTSKYTADINNNGTADSEEEPHTVTFYDTVALTNISQVEVLDGMSAVAPTPRVHENRTFTGWSRGFTNVESSFTVNALYRTTEELASDEIATYTVRFLVGDEEISNQTIESGASATAPIPTKIDRKVFICWDKSFDEVSTDLTVKAVYADDVNENNLNDATETRYSVAFVAGVNGTLEGTTEFTELLINLSLKDNGVTIPTPAPVAGYAFAGWNVELTNETKVAGNTTYTANFKDVEKPIVEIQNVNEYNPKSFDIYATDLESGLRRMDYSLFTNDNTDYLGGGGQWIDGSVYEFELNNIADYSLEEVKYLLKDLSEGEYTLRVTVSDNDENITHAINVNFEVDKIAPKFNLTSGYHNDDNIQVIITEKNFLQVKIYNQDSNSTINEENSTFELTEEATYRLTAKDKAGNEAIIWVAIDKTYPEIFNNDELIINDSHYKEDLVLTIKDKFLLTAKINGQVERSLTRNDFEVGKKNENFSYSEILTESGNYEVIAKDKFGNTTTINFVIDKIAPLIKINNADPKEFYNDQANVSATDENLDTLKVYQLTRSKRGKERRTEVENPANTEGKYLAVATDKAGNTSEVRFTINKTSPVIYGNHILLLTDENYFNKNVKLTATDDNLDTITVDGTLYRGEFISPAGEYTVVATDKAGNQTTRTFIIDKTAPVIKINDADPKDSYNDQANVSATDDNLDTLEVYRLTRSKHGKEIRELVQNPANTSGNYLAVATDKAGNTSEVRFTIQIIVPTGDVSYSEEDLTKEDVIASITFSQEVKDLSNDWVQSDSDSKVWTKTFKSNTEETVEFENKSGVKGENLSVTIGNIDKYAPTVNITHSPNTTTTDEVTVSINATDVGVAGLHDDAYSFDGGTTWGPTNTITVGTNQTLSIQVRDKLKNIISQDYNIENIVPKPFVDLINIGNSKLIYKRHQGQQGPKHGKLDLSLSLNSDADNSNVKNIIVKYYEIKKDNDEYLNGKDKMFSGCDFFKSYLTDYVNTGNNGEDKKYKAVITINYNDSTASKTITIESR